MRKIGPQILKMVGELGKDSDSARLNMRIRQVRERYKAAIERVYDPTTARFHLAHTNSVIIRDKAGVKTLIVYVDDSMCAADLNAQRELVKLALLELAGEEVQDFEINISKWKKYRDVHPYLDDSRQEPDLPLADIPLDADEESFVSNIVSHINDESVRKSLEKAMTADLKRKKEKNVDTRGKNTK